MKNKRGFSLIEMLVALFCVSVTSLLFVPIVKGVHSIYHQQQHVEDHIHLHTLRISLALGYDVSVENQQIRYRKNEQTYTLSLHRNRLVQQPGFVIYLKDIDNLSFVEEHNHVYLRFYREGEWYETWLLHL